VPRLLADRLPDRVRGGVVLRPPGERERRVLENGVVEAADCVVLEAVGGPGGSSRPPPGRRPSDRPSRRRPRCRRASRWPRQGANTRHPR
jgi:hypothetical protein